MEEINIWWEGPFSQSDIIENKITKKESDNIQKDIGLYQVYSSHPLYGSDVLVYIGLTINSFQRRLKNRWVIENGNDTDNVTIYLGCIFSPSKTINTKIEITKIKKAESLLINAMKPAFNSSNIQSVKEQYHKANYQINNLNNYRSLYPQLSSKYYWDNQFKNYEITDNLAKEYNTKAKNENDFYGFSIPNTDNDICFGIDDNHWNMKNIPLVIGVYKNSMDKSKLMKKFKDIDEEENEDGYFFITAADDLTSENVIEEIKEKLKIVTDLYRNS